MAAAARASGIRNQVGLKPNPAFGFNGSQMGDAGTDQYSLFVEQTFVRGDKLAWNQQVIGHDVNAMNWMVETQRQRLRTDIRLAFYEALRLMQNARNAGEYDFFRVLTARRAYFDANIKYVVALGQLAQTNATLDGLLLTGGLSATRSV